MKRSGFTLVELMIVVSVIAILTVIAIPMYTKMQGKAKQSEAKVNLGSIYSTLKIFETEKKSLSNCLEEVGVAFTGDRAYTIGFSADSDFCGGSTGPCDCIAWDNATPPVCVTACAPVFGADQSHYLNTKGTAVAVGDLVVGGVEANIPTATTFRIRAAGKITTATSDVWTITETKALDNTTPNY